MERPEEFEQDFDWRYSRIAQVMARNDWNKWVDYRGPEEE